MPRGKKYNAAEKHFIEKEKTYKKQIARLNEYIKAQDLEIKRLKALMDEQDYKILMQNDWINRLLEYTELEKSDIRAACEADKHRKDAFTAVAHAADAIRRVMPCIY